MDSRLRGNDFQDSPDRTRQPQAGSIMTSCHLPAGSLPDLYRETLTGSQKSVRLWCGYPPCKVEFSTICEDAFFAHIKESDSKVKKINSQITFNVNKNNQQRKSQN